MVDITKGSKPQQVLEIIDAAEKVVHVKGYVLETNDGSFLSENWEVITQDVGMMLTTVHRVERNCGENGYTVSHMTFAPSELEILGRAVETWNY